MGCLWRTAGKRPELGNGHILPPNPVKSLYESPRGATGDISGTLPPPYDLSEDTNGSRRDRTSANL